MIIETNQHTTKILQPREQAFDLPTPFVAAKFPTVLRFLTPSIRFMRRNHLGLKSRELFIERIRIVSLIADQLSRSLVGKTRKQSLLDKSDFVRRSTLCVNGERKTSALCHCHELRAFTPLGRSHSEAPFFATINVPSMKHSDKSRPPRVCKSSANVSSTFVNVPSRAQAWKRRWQVWYGGNLPGRSHHLAPERKIHNTPLRTSRSSRRGLPRVWTDGVLSKSDSIKDHCSSVNSSRRDIREILSNYF